MRKLDTAQHSTWEKTGQVVEGTLLKIERMTGDNTGYIARLRTDEGITTISCPALLSQALNDNFDELNGKLIRITFTKQDAAKGKKSGMKHFDVEYDDTDDDE